MKVVVIGATGIDAAAAIGLRLGSSGSCGLCRAVAREVPAGESG
jgi:hypothetical protein